MLGASPLLSLRMAGRSRANTLMSMPQPSASRAQQQGARQVLLALGRRGSVWLARKINTTNLRARWQQQHCPIRMLLHFDSAIQKQPGRHICKRIAVVLKVAASYGRMHNRLLAVSASVDRT
eukprot:m.46320 g.46320  ORF g.46320 m.46320 type:complete len:122 (-) comp6294_c0_seq4:1366-1731(-)